MTTEKSIAYKLNGELSTKVYEGLERAGYTDRDSIKKGFDGKVFIIDSPTGALANPREIELNREELDIVISGSEEEIKKCQSKLEEISDIKLPRTKVA